MATTASGQTPNLGLSQWARTDDFNMDDFNSDNAIIDAALANVGNCKIETGHYTGTGTYSPTNPNSLTFNFEPKFVIIYYRGVFTSNAYSHAIFFGGYGYSKSADSGSPTLYVTWDGTTMNWYNDYNSAYQLNTNGAYYCYAAFGE